MWNTPRGVRKLAGIERQLFVGSLLVLYDMLTDAAKDGQILGVCISAFDELPVEDQPFVLVMAAEGLLTDSPPPPVRAWNAAAIAAVYGHLEPLIELEVHAEAVGISGPGDSTYWRTLLHNAWVQIIFPIIDVTFPEGRGNRQQPTSSDMNEWDFKIRCLEMEVLEDDDFNMQHFMDADPDKAQKAKEFLGIDDEYFTDTPPHLSEKERDRLHRYCRSLQAEEPT